jgi:hypothetical protein
MDFLKTSKSFHKWLAETHPAAAEFLKASLNRQDSPKLRGRTRIPVISKRDGQYFNPGKHH